MADDPVLQPFGKSKLWKDLGGGLTAEAVVPVDGSGAVMSSGSPSDTGTQTSVASSATSVTILAASASRKGLAITNDSTQTLYLLFAAGTASSTNFSVPVPPQGYISPSALNYRGIIKGIWVSANGFARVTEFT